MHDDVVVSTVASQRKALQPVPVHACVLSYSKNMHVRLIGDSILTLGGSVHGCLSLCWPCVRHYNLM